MRSMSKRVTAAPRRSSADTSARSITNDTTAMGCMLPRWLSSRLLLRRRAPVTQLSLEFTGVKLC